MTIKFPRTYKDLQNADYVWDIEKGGTDGVFIYLKESYLKDVNGEVLTDETIAWGVNLQEALDNLRYDYWKYIDPSYKVKKYKPRKTKQKKQIEYNGSFIRVQKLLSKIL